MELERQRHQVKMEAARAETAQRDQEAHPELYRTEEEAVAIAEREGIELDLSGVYRGGSSRTPYFANCSPGGDVGCKGEQYYFLSKASAALELHFHRQRSEAGAQAEAERRAIEETRQIGLQRAAAADLTLPKRENGTFVGVYEANTGRFLVRANGSRKCPGWHLGTYASAEYAPPFTPSIHALHHAFPIWQVRGVRARGLPAQTATRVRLA
jgi:hypothetical protein